MWSWRAGRRSCSRGRAPSARAWAGSCTAAYPVFAAAFDEVCAAFDGLLPGSLRDVVFGGADLDRTEWAQPGLFALEVALFELVSSWGVRADVLLGHSIGELAAAYVAGVWSLADACRIVAARGRLMQALPEGGAMVAVEAAEDELPDLPGGVSVAAVNGPRSLVLSGDEEPVTALAQAFAEQGRRTKQLTVSHAFHSARMEPMLAEFAETLAAVEFRPPRIPVVSNVTGGMADAEFTTPDYWVRHVREAVRFADGVGAAHATGVRRYLELGPDGTLTTLAHDTAHDAGRDVAAVPALRGDQPETRTVVAAVGRLYATGLTVDWPAFFAPYGAHRTELPTYAFQHRRYWLEPVAPPSAPPANPLRYRTAWASVPDGPRPSLSGTWAVVVPESGSYEDIVAGVTAALRDHGARPVVVEVDPAGPERADVADTLRAALGDDAGGVVSLLGTADSLSSGVAATAVLMQAWTDLGGGARLWCLTRGAVSVSPSDPLAAPARAQLWGLGRVAALEHPERWGGLVDLPAVPDDRAWTRLCTVLAGESGEDQVAVRAAGLFARRLGRAGTRADAAPAGPSPWRTDGTVLVTGGTGALGAHVARWLAEAGAAHVLLTSRRGPDADGAAELTARLRETGTEVTVAACDVTDRDALAALISGLPADRPLTGVVHAAGVLDDGVLDSLTPDRFAAVAGPR